MPRTKEPANPGIECKIGARLSELRRLLGLSQSKFAKVLGLTRVQLSNLELGRSPLRYPHAARALGADVGAGDRTPGILPFNPLWLAGEDDWPIQLSWPMLLPAPEDIGLATSAKFSEFVRDNPAMLRAFASDTPSGARLPESWLQPYFTQWLKLCERATREFNATLSVQDLLRNSLIALAPESPKAKRTLQLYGETGLGAADMEVQKLAAKPEWAWLSKKSSGKVLTGITSKRNIAAMESPLANLMDRVRRASQRAGRKAKLAKFLNVPRSRVSEWLRDKDPVSPSGETTLRLLNWVEQQEAQQKSSPGSASTLPGPKTQSGRSNEKKSKSSPSEH